MNRKNAIVLVAVIAVLAVVLLTLAGGADDRVTQLRSQLGIVKQAIASYQADNAGAMPKTVEEIAAVGEEARTALADPWRPGELMALEFGASGYVVRFENDTVVATIDRSLDVAVVEK